MFSNCHSGVGCKIDNISFIFPIYKNVKVYPNANVSEVLGNSHPGPEPTEWVTVYFVGLDQGPESRSCSIRKVFPLSPCAIMLEILSLEIHSFGLNITLSLKMQINGIKH